MEELYKVYRETEKMGEIEYLGSDQKRVFILENCRFRKVKVEVEHLAFERIGELQDLAILFQEGVAREKKESPKKQKELVLSNKQSHREEPQGNNQNNLVKRKSKNKEPAVLEVNLV